MITLSNNERKLVTYEIPVAVGGGVELHVARVDRVASSTPGKSVTAVKRVFPTTITLSAKGTHGSTSAPVPDEFALVPSIAKAIAERRLSKSIFTSAPRAERE